MCYYYSYFTHNETGAQRGYGTCWRSLKQPEFALGVSNSAALHLSRCGQLPVTVLVRVYDWLIRGRASGYEVVLAAISLASS